MTAKARHYEAELSKIVFDSGAKILERGKDGAGHCTITVGMNGYQRLFHFPSTGASRGHGILNCKARLRRLIREIPPAAVVETPVIPLPQPEPADMTASLVITPDVAPIIFQKPRRPRLTKEKRKEIAKRYLSLKSIEDLMAEFDLSKVRAEILIMSQRGQAADKLRKEKVRNLMAKRTVSQAVAAVPILPEPQPAATRKRLSLWRRNQTIRKMTRARKTMDEISKAVGLSKRRVRIAVR